MNINDKSISVSNYKCEPDDYIVSFSDGIIHAGVGKILNLGWSHNEVS